MESNIAKKPAIPQPAALHPAARAWMAQLPSCIELRALPARYPRIANRLAELWKHPAQCERYIDELLFNNRPDIRQGFPPPVCREIMQLKYALEEAFMEHRRQHPMAFA